MAHTNPRHAPCGRAGERLSAEAALRHPWFCQPPAPAGEAELAAVVAHAAEEQRKRREEGDRILAEQLRSVFGARGDGCTAAVHGWGSDSGSGSEEFGDVDGSAFGGNSSEVQYIWRRDDGEDGDVHREEG